MLKRVVMLNLSETRRDPRVRRVAASLARTGAEVTVIGRTWEVAERDEQLDGFRLLRLDGPRRTERADMGALHRVAPRTAELIAAIHPPLMNHEHPRGLRYAFRAHRKLKTWATRWGAQRPAAERVLAMADPLFAERALIHELRAMILINVSMFEMARDLRPDVVHANDLNTLLAGAMLHHALGVPLVYDAHEIFAEQYPDDERHPVWHRFYTELERRLVGATTLRFTVSDAIARYFEEHRGAQPFITLRNVPSVSKLVSEHTLERRNARPRLTFQGAYVRYRGIDEIIRAAPRVPEADFILRGFGVHEPALRALAQRAGGALSFAPPVPMTEMVQAASECDVGMCPTVSTSLNMDYSLPNKVFEYAMSGLAVAVSDLVELRRVVDEHALGIVLPSLDPEPMAAALRALVTDPERLRAHQRSAWTAARDLLNWECEEHRLLDAYAPLLAAVAPPS